MKRILIIILLTGISCIVSAQRIVPHIGFYLDDDEHYHLDNRIFYFGGDSTFTYMHSSDQTYFGAGRYELKGDKLILNFAHSEMPEKAHRQLFELTSTSGISDTLEIALRIIGITDGEKLVGASIYELRTRIGTQTDLEGLGKMKLGRLSDQKTTLAVDWIKYNRLLIPIEANVSKVIGKVYLTDVSFYKAGDQLIFPLKKWTNSQLIVARTASYETDEKNHKKIKPEKIKYWVGNFYYTLFEEYRSK